MKDYLNNDYHFDKKTFIGILAFIAIISGIFGFVYEFLFYYMNSGFKTFYYRGGNFLPWINIYATGSIMIYFLTYRFRRKPLLVFLISFISTGVLEYISGFGMLYFRGLRCWNYNTEILNFLNIDGFVCLRSVMFFGLSSLLLIYLFVPLAYKIASSKYNKLFVNLSIIILSIILIDEFYNLLFARLLHLPRARNIYTKLGFKYMPVK